MADEKTQPEKGTTEYVLDEKSGVGEVIVDGKSVTTHQSAKLTQDQYDRASADPDVKLVEKEG